MKVFTDDNDADLKGAVALAEGLLLKEEFYSRISEVESFELSTASPGTIASLLRESQLEFEVILFTPKNLFERIKYRKTMAFTDHRYPNMLFINSRKMNRTRESIAATIIHEAIHSLDHDCEEHSFGHGNNRSKGKGNTAPYWIGNLAHKMMKNNSGEQDIDFSQEVEEVVIDTN